MQCGPTFRLIRCVGGQSRPPLLAALYNYVRSRSSASAVPLPTVQLDDLFNCAFTAAPIYSASGLMVLRSYGAVHTKLGQSFELESRHPALRGMFTA